MQSKKSLKFLKHSEIAPEVTALLADETVFDGWFSE